MGDSTSLPELAPEMGDDILQGVAELRPGSPQARSRALNLLLKEASRMFPLPQASQDGTPKRLSPAFLKGAARRTRGARRIPRRHLTMTELQSPAERDDTTPSSSSPSSSRTSSSSPAHGVDSAASSSTSRPSSPFAGSSTCSPAASPLDLGSETGEDTEPPSPTEGDPGTPERPQPRDGHTPSPSSAPRGEAAADGTAGHDAPDLGRPPTTPLDGEHTPAAESLPRAGVMTTRAAPPDRRLPRIPRGSPGRTAPQGSNSAASLHSCHPSPRLLSQRRADPPADGTAGHDAPDLGRPPTTPLDGEHTPAAESLPRAAEDEGAGGCHGEPAPDNESSTPRSPAASYSSWIAGADGAAGQQQRGFSRFLPPIPEVAEPEESRPPCAIVTGASPAAAPVSGTTAHAPTSPSHLRPVADDGAHGGPSPLAPSQRLSASSPPRSAKQKKKRNRRGKTTTAARARALLLRAMTACPRGSAGGNPTHLLGPRPKPSAPSRVPATVSPTPEDPASCQTVLYRPTSRKAHFLATSRDAIAAFLSGVPGAHPVRANVVAVDTLPGADLTALLAVRVICDVHVRAKALALNTCCEKTFDESTIIEGLESSVPVLSATRNGDAVVLRFAGSMVPAEVHLFRQRRVVYPRLPRPLQCGRCGLFGHATWQLERRVAATLANSKPRITRKQALEHVRGSGATAAPSPKQHPVTQRATKRGPPSSRLQPGLSYSAALKGGTQAGSSSSTRGDSGEPPATDDNPAQPPGASPPATTELVVTALASALRSLLELVPADSPARHMCVAALAMHDALVQHG
ncbi:nascent polypeptide-associated complex subunit alpha, muscle-specific form-like [Dermacentor silvarum]|uniref:nascent polypeptide-associated complex subunit alpha, muscle-specific form-like n=1 Tax=Dermacentor silvarum TaxID=543639 RepID=UPI001898DE9C|nr:nascent polypeptide-associated complex subunit alpha, muscle-specific form-like [Dermacentor silvarum]